MFTYDRQPWAISPNYSKPSACSSRWSAFHSTSHPVFLTRVKPAPQDFTITYKDIHAFKRLLDEKVVRQFLDWDSCCLLADKYLLAFVLTYFKRAKLVHQQYTPVYFFVALYLAHDMEEDDADMKNDLIRFALSSHTSRSVNDSTIRLFHRKKDKLWHQLDMRTAVNHLCCEAIMKCCLPGHQIWRRERHQDHGGVSVPFAFKSLVHKEMRLTHSYYECDINCIVCECRKFYHRQLRLDALHTRTEPRSVASVNQLSIGHQLHQWHPPTHKSRSRDVLHRGSFNHHEVFAAEE